MLCTSQRNAEESINQGCSKRLSAVSVVPFKAKSFGEGLEEDTGKVSLFSVASPNSFREEWNPIRAVQHP